MATFKVVRWSGASRPDARELKQRLEADGYSVFEWSDSPGTMYEPHSHAEDQSHWIISGALQLTVEGQTYTLQAGDRDFLPARTTHAAFVPGDTPVRYLIAARK
ncbi:MAG TPA: cupin domain-containing protein [Pyrinomonadaceae bacterium]